MQEIKDEEKVLVSKSEYLEIKNLVQQIQKLCDAIGDHLQKHDVIVEKVLVDYLTRNGLLVSVEKFKNPDVRYIG